MLTTPLSNARLFAGLLLFAGVLLPAQGQPHYTIASGSVGATFYPTAQALCHRIAELTLDFSCEAVATPGSEYNLRSLQGGSHDLALSQQHLQYLAWRGCPPFEAPHPRLRTIAPLYREVFLLAVTPGSGIESLHDLPGKRVNIGNRGSGTRLVVEQLFDFLGWEASDFIIHERSSGELTEWLCGRRIDAAIYSTGHPNAIYQHLIEQCGIRLIPLWSDDIAEFVKTDSAYLPAFLPAGTYKSQSKAIRGFGLQILLSGHRDLPADHVAAILRVLATDKPALAKEAPIYRSVDASRKQLLRAAPYHEGVTRFHGDSARTPAGSPPEEHDHRALDRCQDPAPAKHG